MDTYNSVPPITPTKPGLLTAVGVMTLVNGILNLFWGLGLTATIVLGTLGLGLLCAPLFLVPCVIGIFEIVYGAKLLANPVQRGTQPSTAIAVWEILCILSGNVLSAVVGILALVFYGDESVKNYFARINS